MATGNAINANSTGLVRYNGSGTFDSVTTTNHDVLIGAASNGITNVAPSATSGVPLISQGASSDPAFGTAVVAGGGTGLTTTTAYGLIAGGTTATGNFQNTGAGSSGQVLVSGGASALPAWTNASTAGSSWVLIQTQAASNSATIDFTTGITSTYTNYVFVLSNVVPANSTNLTMVVSVNGGSSYITTNYQAGDNITSYNSATWANSNTTTSMVITGGLSNTDPGLSGTFWLSNITTAKPPVANWSTMQWNGVRMGVGASYNTTTSGVNAFRWAAVTGNITSGNFSLYGIRST
jgi:hypothetical protein